MTHLEFRLLTALDSSRTALNINFDFPPKYILTVHLSTSEDIAL